VQAESPTELHDSGRQLKVLLWLSFSLMQF